VSHRQGERDRRDIHGRGGRVLELPGEGEREPAWGTPKQGVEQPPQRHQGEGLMVHLYRHHLPQQQQVPRVVVQQRSPSSIHNLQRLYQLHFHVRERLHGVHRDFRVPNPSNVESCRCCDPSHPNHHRNRHNRTPKVLGVRGRDRCCVNVLLLYRGSGIHFRVPSRCDLSSHP